MSRYRSAFAGWQAPAYVIVGVIATGFVLSMAGGLPGELSYNSVIQLLEGRTAHYSGWHPPVMSWLLGLADAVQPGTGLYVLANATGFFVATASVPWLVRKQSWWGVIAALFCVLTPQLVIYQSTVWKDVLFADATVVAFVLLAHAANVWEHTSRRLALLTAACLFAALAALARQNGAIVLFGLAAGVILVARRSGARLSGALLSGVASLVLTAGIVLARRNCPVGANCRSRKCGATGSPAPVLRPCRSLVCGSAPAGSGLATHSTKSSRAHAHRWDEALFHGTKRHADPL